MLTYWRAWLGSKLNEENGQSLVEYALITVLIAIGLIAVITLLVSRRGATIP